LLPDLEVLLRIENIFTIAKQMNFERNTS